MELSEGEREFVDEARRRILDHATARRTAGFFDELHAVVRSTSGRVYDGVPFETSMPQFDFCAERHAINNMLYAETEAASVDAVLVAGPVPDEDADVTTPCGACRHAIHQFGDDATVFCSNFVREAEGWNVFPEMERYTAEELYPHPGSQPQWE